MDRKKGASGAVSKPRQKSLLRTYTLRLAGMLVIRAEAGDPDEACKKTMSVFGHRTKKVILDDSLFVISPTSIQEGAIGKSRQTAEISSGERSNKLAEALMYLIREPSEAAVRYVKTMAVEDDLRMLVEHVGDVRSHGTDDYLTSVDEDLGRALKLVRRARETLIKRSETRLNDNYTPGTESP